MDGKLFTELIQFCWTLTTLLFGVQAWIFLQEFKCNRNLKWKHMPLLFAVLANIISVYFLFHLFNLVLDESLKQDQNLLLDAIKNARVLYMYFLFISFIFSGLSALFFLFLKGKKRNKWRK